MKKSIFTLFSLLVSLGAIGGVYSLLKVNKTDGSQASVAAMGTKVAYTDGNLVATPQSGSGLSVPVSALASMEFGDGTASPLKGDVNGDGEVNAADVSALTNMILNGTPGDNYDINGDGETNTADISEIVNIVLGNTASAAANSDGTQTMWVHTGNVKWAFTTDQVGEMAYTDGTSVTIQNKTFAISEIDSITIDGASVADNNIGVTYAGTEAQVVVSGNIAAKITASVTGADVTVTQAADVDKEYTYTLSGQSDNGSFTQNGEYKSTLVLSGLNLTSATGAAVTISTGKRVAVVVAEGTTNTLVDAAGGKQKAALYFSGHPEFEGAGTLNVTGNTKHAISAKEYLQLKKSAGTINILGAESDGIHCGKGKKGDENNYFQINGGNVTMTGVKGDCIDSDDYGNVIIKGGTLNLTVDAEDVVGIKADSLLTMSGGNVTLNVAGKMSKGVRVSYKGVFSGGKITATVTGDGGKGIDGQCYTTTDDADKTTFNGGDLEFSGTDIDMNLTSTYVVVNGDTTKVMAINTDKSCIQSGGTITIETSGKDVNAVSVDGNLTVTGGTLDVTSTGDASKCIKVDGQMTVGAEGTAGPRIIAGTSGKKAGTTTGTTTGGWRPGKPGGGGTSSSGGSPKAVKVLGVFTMKSGYMEVATSSEGGEGIESKNTMYFDGGDVVAYCYDDCINCTGKIYVRGARLWCFSNGNDAIDSNANTTGSFEISDGVCVAVTSKGGAEMGIDADGNNHLTVKGGTLFTAGGNQGGSSSSLGSATQGYYWLTGKSFAANTYYTLADASGNNIFTVKLPVGANNSYSLISSPSMSKGSTYTIKSSSEAPTDATEVFEGLYLGSSAKGTTSLASFTAQ